MSCVGGRPGVVTRSPKVHSKQLHRVASVSLHCGPSERTTTLQFSSLGRILLTLPCESKALVVQVGPFTSRRAA